MGTTVMSRTSDLSHFTRLPSEDLQHIGGSVGPQSPNLAWNCYYKEPYQLLQDCHRTKTLNCFKKDHSCVHKYR